MGTSIFCKILEENGCFRWEENGVLKGMKGTVEKAPKSHAYSKTTPNWPHLTSISFYNVKLCDFCRKVANYAWRIGRKPAVTRVMAFFWFPRFCSRLVCYGFTNFAINCCTDSTYIHSVSKFCSDNSFWHQTFYFINNHPNSVHIICVLRCCPVHIVISNVRNCYE